MLPFLDAPHRVSLSRRSIFLGSHPFVCELDANARAVPASLSVSLFTSYLLVLNPVLLPALSFVHSVRRLGQSVCPCFTWVPWATRDVQPLEKIALVSVNKRWDEETRIIIPSESSALGRITSTPPLNVASSSHRTPTSFGRPQLYCAFTR